MTQTPSTTLQPLGDRIVVRQNAAATEQHGSIIVPDAHKEKPQTGTVLAIGDAVAKVGVGDTVLFGKYTGTEVTIDREVLLILNGADLLAIVREPSPVEG